MTDPTNDTPTPTPEVPPEFAAPDPAPPSRPPPAALGDGAVIDCGFLLARIRRPDGHTVVGFLSLDDVPRGLAVEELGLLAAAVEQMRFDITINGTADAVLGRLARAQDAKRIVQAAAIPRAPLTLHRK